MREKTEPDYFSKVYKDRSGVKEMAKVFNYDLWGKRETKYKFLEEVKFRDVEWIELQPTQPNYFFAPKNFDLATEYNQGFNVDDIFLVKSTGVVTHRDHFVMDFDFEVLRKRIEDFRSLNITNQEISNIYNLKDTRDWNLELRRKSLATNKNWEKYFTVCLYRPFDSRFYYHHQDVVEYPRQEVMQNMTQFSNLSLIVCRQQKSIGFQHCYVTDLIGEGNNISIHSRERSYHFPLYIYPNVENEQINLFLDKNPNFSPEFLTAIKEKLGYTPTPEKIFYYAYAIFHSPTYRQRYAEFLKIDFPRLPLTRNNKLFNNLATQGEQLVALHLLKSDQFHQLITTYEGEGDNQVTQVIYNDQLQRVNINPQKYFANIPKQIWEFKIGGYQVLEKWLKDRKKSDRALSDEDIIHYQKIVIALQQTLTIMTEIDQLIPSFPIE